MDILFSSLCPGKPGTFDNVKEYDMIRDIFFEKREVVRKYL